MAKRDKMEDSHMIDVMPEPVEVPSAVKPLVLVAASRTKTYGFEQWAGLRNKPERHWGGMRAYLGADAGNKFTLDVWDAKMLAY